LAAPAGSGVTTLGIGSSSFAAEAAEAGATTLASQLQFTATTAVRQATTARRVPLQILARAIQTGRRMADPQAAAGAVKIVSDMYKNGKLYQLEIIYRQADKMILHFHYQ